MVLLIMSPLYEHWNKSYRRRLQTEREILKRMQEGARHPRRSVTTLQKEPRAAPAKFKQKREDMWEAMGTEPKARRQGSHRREATGSHGNGAESKATGKPQTGSHGKLWERSRKPGDREAAGSHGPGAERKATGETQTGSHGNGAESKATGKTQM